MKIILSRKGFDSKYGGYPSPILDDGRMLSIPIPEADSNINYKSLQLNSSISYFDIMSQLFSKIKTKKGNIDLNQTTGCHLDPDINKRVLIRQNGWKGLFGQSDIAQKHLHKHGIKEEDIFLFYGWFRKTKRENGRLQYDKLDKNGRHIIFGYLQIGEIVNVSTSNLMPWMDYHPHAKWTSEPTNTLYVAKEHLSDFTSVIPGYGFFNYDDSLVLSSSGGDRRSEWKLDKVFRKVNITYHNQNNWKINVFQSNPIGQEFVVDANDKVIDWAKKIIERNCKKG